MKSLIKLALLIIGLCATSVIMHAQTDFNFNQGFLSGISSYTQLEANAAAQDPANQLDALRRQQDEVVDFLGVVAGVGVIVGAVYFDMVEILYHFDGPDSHDLNDNMAFDDSLDDIYDYPDRSDWASGCC